MQGLVYKGVRDVAVETVDAAKIEMGNGQAPVKGYHAELRDLILAGRANPGFLFSHELGLAEAPDAYARFDEREDDRTKVLLHP